MCCHCGPLGRSVLGSIPGGSDMQVCRSSAPAHRRSAYSWPWVAPVACSRENGQTVGPGVHGWGGGTHQGAFVPGAPGYREPFTASLANSSRPTHSRPWKLAQSEQQGVPGCVTVSSPGRSEEGQILMWWKINVCVCVQS